MASSSPLPPPSHPELPTASWEVLRQRADVFRRVRRFFDDRGFIEVDTPLLSADSVVDRYLHPVPVNHFDVTGRLADRGKTLWLQTSPEFAMKRLLTAGATAIYQIARAFRQGESGPQHNPEFTMLEWYRVGDGMSAGMDLLDSLVAEILGTDPAERLSYREAFVRHAGLDPFTAGDRELAEAAGLVGDQAADRDECLNLILAQQVESQLGRGRPTLVFDYPATQAALAQIRPGTPPLAERFEIYVAGRELANGYHELLDADELMRRNLENNRLRQLDGATPLPVESRLLQAMQRGLPPCSGTALGLDRLVMLAVGASRIEEVIPFPLERA